MSKGDYIWIYFGFCWVGMGAGIVPSNPDKTFCLVFLVFKIQDTIVEQL